MKQIGDKNKSETSDQRLWRNTWSLRDLSKAAGVAITFGMTWMTGNAEAWPESSGTALALGGSDNAMRTPTFLDQRTQFIDNSQSERSVPSLPEAFSPPKGPTVQDIWPGLYEEMVKGLEEKGQASKNALQEEAQETYNGETSSEQAKPDKNKSRKSLSSREIATMQASIDKLKENSEALRSLRKTLNDRKEREQSLPESDSKIPAERMLLSDKQSTCSDPCSDTPASVDCIKECTTPNVFGYKHVQECLDVSTSGVSARVENASGRLIPGPGQQVHLDYRLNVQNNCQQAVNQISFQVDGSSVCPPGTGSSIADEPRGFWPGSSALPDPNLVIAPGSFAGVNGSSDWFCMMSTGFDSENYTIPSELSVIVSAQAWTNTGPFYSRGKKFTVLGSVNDGVKPCDQKCSSPNHRHKGPNAGAVAGGVIGAMGALAIAAWCCCCRRKDHSLPIQPPSDARGQGSPRRGRPRSVDLPRRSDDVHPRLAEPSSSPDDDVHLSVPNPMPSERMGYH